MFTLKVINIKQHEFYLYDLISSYSFSFNYLQEEHTVSYPNFKYTVMRDVFAVVSFTYCYSVFRVIC